MTILVSAGASKSSTIHTSDDDEYTVHTNRWPSSVMLTLPISSNGRLTTLRG